MESKWGEKVQGLDYAQMASNNLLFFKKDWAKDKNDILEPLNVMEVEFWFKAEHEAGKAVNLSVLFSTKKETILVGIRKNKMFVTQNAKGRHFHNTILPNPISYPIGICPLYLFE